MMNLLDLIIGLPGHFDPRVAIRVVPDATGGLVHILA